jgi:PST family polysaccharide transporter
MWSFGSTAFSKLGGLAIGVVLARLLGPSEFGTYAVAFVALTIVLSFNELGVSLAIVRWKGDPAEIAPIVTTIAVATSVVLYAIGFAIAPSFATSMGAPSAALTVRVLLLSVILDSLTSTPAALLEREFRQDKRALADQLNVWGGAAVSIALAALGMGAMSLAVGRIVGSLASTIILIKISPLPLRFGFRREKAAELLRFGLPLAGASIVVIAAGNVDQLVVGHLLGATALGYFVLAFNVSSWPVGMFSKPVRTVAPAAFARMHAEPEKRTDSFRSIMRLIAVAALPVCGFLAGGAPFLIRFVYGSAWDSAAPVLRWLAVVAALRIVFELAYDYLVVLGRSGWVLGVQAIWFVLLFPALLVGGTWGGVAGVAAAEASVALFAIFPLYLVLLSRSGIPTGLVLRSIALPAVGAAVAVVVSLGLGSALVAPLAASLAGGFTTMAIVAVLVWRERAAIREVRAVRAVPAT